MRGSARSSRTNVSRTITIGGHRFKEVKARTDIEQRPLDVISGYALFSCTDADFSKRAVCVKQSKLRLLKNHSTATSLYKLQN
jgi:hypothetical protein